LAAGVGVVEYSNADDMKYALRKLDDTEFVGNYTGGRAYIRIREDRPAHGGGGGGGGRDRDRRRCVACGAGTGGLFPVVCLP
jgi:hypothetical protein